MTPIYNNYHLKINQPFKITLNLHKFSIIITNKLNNILNRMIFIN